MIQPTQLMTETTYKLKGLTRELVETTDCLEKLILSISE